MTAIITKMYSAQTKYSSRTHRSQVERSPIAQKEQAKTAIRNQEKTIKVIHTCALTDAPPSGDPPSSPHGRSTRYSNRSEREIIPMTLSSSLTTTSL